MARAGWSLRGLGVLTGLLVALTASGCIGDDDGNGDGARVTTQGESIAQMVCRSRANAGDTDCDGVLDRYDKAPGQNDFRTDSDGDNVVDAFDRFQGDDYGDPDRDGFVNRVDLAPYRATVTVSPQVVSPSTAQAAGQAQQEALQQQEAQRLATEAQRLANESAKLEFLNQQLDRELKDSDGDNIPDINDPQTYMRFGDDDDGDDTPNGRDRFPLNDGYD